MRYGQTSEGFWGSLALLFLAMILAGIVVCDLIFGPMLPTWLHLIGGLLFIVSLLLAARSRPFVRNFVNFLDWFY